MIRLASARYIIQLSGGKIIFRLLIQFTSIVLHFHINTYVVCTDYQPHARTEYL